MNKKFTFLLSFLLYLPFFMAAQPFAVGETSITFNDPARANRNIPTTIFYPAATAGTNVAPATGQHCLVVFGHGFVISYTNYIWLANALAPQGYIVAFPETEGGIPPSHGDFGLDIAFLVSAIQAEGANATSILFGAVGANSAVGGHSMGGGASFLAAGGNASITALFNFAAAETNPSAIAAASNVLVPTLMFEGTDDCVTPSADHTAPMYANLNTSCQTLVSITGASHCQFANSDFICGFGQIGCGGNISEAAQETEVLNYLLPFLNYHLKDDCDAGTTFDDLINNPTASTTQSNCTVPLPGCNSCAAVDLNILFDGFPAQTSWEILDNTGTAVVTSPGYSGQAGNTSLSTSPACLPDGCYTLNFNDALNNGMCPFQSSAVGVSTFITPGTLITPGSIVGTLSLVATPGLCGSYSLTDANGTTLASGGGNFGAVESNTFCLSGGIAPKYNNVNNPIFSKNGSPQGALSIFPNPAANVVSIQLPISNVVNSTSAIKMYDANGRLLLNYKVEQLSKQTFELNIAAFKNGVYQVVVTNGNNATYSAAFVKE